MADPEEFYADEADIRRLLEREGHPTEEIETDQLEAFHDDANMVISEELEDTDQSDRRLGKIEARLAGHYILDSGIDSVRQADRIVEHDGTTRWFGDTEATGLTGTTLGQQALELDSSGKLRALIVPETDDSRGGVVRNTDRHVRSVRNPDTRPPPGEVEDGEEIE